MIYLFLFIAAFIQGLSGFGFNLIALPLISISFPLTYTVPFLTLIGTYLNVFQLFQLKKKPSAKIVLPLLISGLIFVPVGMIFLLKVPNNILKLCVGFLIILAAFFLAKGFRIKGKSLTFQCIIGGALSGILKGAASIGGPPVVILLSNFDLDKETYKSNLISYFMLVGILALPSYIKANLFTKPMVLDSFKGLFIAFIGLQLGHFIFKKLGEKHFQKITYSIVIITGIFTVISSL